MRVGVNTGPVLLGNVATTTEFTAIGDAVNVASRLEHAAPLDGVLTSHDTYRHVRGVFDVHELDPVRAHAARPTRCGSTSLSGPRSEPFGWLPAGWKVSRPRPSGGDPSWLACARSTSTLFGAPGVRLVVVAGEAGVGKSRLLYEFRNWIELRREKVFMFMGRALLGQEGQILGLMRDMIATRFDVRLSDPPADVATKLRDGFAPQLDNAEADVVGHWLGFEIGPSDAVTRLAGSPDFASVGRAHLFGWFATLTREEPGVLLLEDLHWADDETLDLLALLALRRDMHLLVVGLARPALYERRPEWAPDAVRIELQALGPDACRELVREVLKHAGDVPEALVDMIASRADGNPFYVEELVKMLIDDCGDRGRRTRRAMAHRCRSIGPITSAGHADRRPPGSPRQPASNRTQRVAAGLRGGQDLLGRRPVGPR